MEVDDSIQTQVSKFQRICCNDDKDRIDTSSNPSNKIGIITNKLSTYEGDRWPSSRIVRVSRASGGKDRHSKVLTSKGLRDRRVRLSVTTAIQFYDLQDRLGYDQPSKAVEWLIKAAATSIAELPSLDQSSFVHFNNINNDNNNVVDRDDEKKVVGDVDDVLLSKSYSSSASEETSKGSGGLCLSRSENRIRARERARGLAAAKKEKENNNNNNGGVSQTTSSFTDLLTSGGIRNSNNNNNNTSTPMDYFQMEQQFGNNCSQSQQQPHFSFLQENLSYGTSSGYNNNNNRGTLQSNLMSNLPHHHHLLQRFQQPMVDGSTSTNSPFFIAPNMGGSGSSNQFLATGLDSQRLRLYGGDGGGHYYDHHKDKSKS